MKTLLDLHPTALDQNLARSLSELHKDCLASFLLPKEHHEGRERLLGTGFFVATPDATLARLYTARHVLEEFDHTHGRITVDTTGVKLGDIGLRSLHPTLDLARWDNDALREQVKRHEENIAALTSPGMWDAAPAVDEPAPGPEAVEEGEPVVTVAAAVRRAAEENDHLTFLQSAFSSAEDSPFRHPERALQALQAINEVAGVWQNSLKSKKSVGSLKDHFKKLGFTYADDVSQTSGNRYGDEYEAKDGGRTYDISPHITIGAKQADSCLSIHWAWDESTGKAVVAHVGRHKTNTSS